MAKKTSDDYKLACEPCRESGIEMQWSDTTLMDVMQMHFDLDHPEEDRIRLVTVWVGKGPEPPPLAENRAVRRARERRRKRKGK